MAAPTTFATSTKLFHWATAALIIVIAPLGVIANRLPHETSAELALKAQIFSAHKTLGVAVFFVALLRILWALTHSKPGPLHPKRKAETLMAEVVHWLLYISLVAVPLTGWIEHAATSGFAPIKWPWGQSLPFVPQSQTLAGTFAGLHWAFGKLMVLSILLHIAGALKHHVIDKDATLRRMWFGSRDMPTVDPHVAIRSAPVLASLAFVATTGLAIGLGLTEPHNQALAPAPLETVVSDWTVTDGAIDIEVTQFGSTVAGSFADWTSEISFDPTPTEVMGSVTTVVSIGSLTLGSVTAEAMGADYFNVAEFPTATFAADITPADSGFIAEGLLTMKGVTAPLSLPFDLSLDGDTANMTGQFTIDRMDYAVGASQTDEGSLGFGVDVDIRLTAIKTKP